MPTYNFTSDLRIATLPSRLETAANEIINNELSSDKSASNNRATLAFYFNLLEGTNTLKLAANGSITEVIRNFVRKFQFPNTYTPELFVKNKQEKTLVVPLRECVKLLAYQYLVNKIEQPYLTFDEIRYYVFATPNRWINARVETYTNTIQEILDNRSNNFDYTSEIESKLSWKQYERQSRELVSVIPYACDAFVIKKGMLILSMPSPLSENFADDLHFIAGVLDDSSFWDCSNFDYNTDTKVSYIQYMDINGDVELCRQSSPQNINPIKFPRQIIYYGAPGTGKSFTIDAMTDEENSVRTTFHPDSDYSTFVGCYKPIKKSHFIKPLIAAEDLIEQASAISGVANQVQFLCDNAESIIAAADEKGVTTNKLIWDSFKWHNETYFVSILKSLLTERKKNTEGEITYDFTPQAFTNAYVKAWQNPDTPQFLIIEEINRGNCAQIFGDIFQLLDRDESGYSSYKITPDKDLENYLREQFSDADIEDADIKSGAKMQLPPNLYIWATMNTSDQSLFPIDSAFKRRWDWKYIPIDYTDRGHYIAVGNREYIWSDFLDKVNQHIESVTLSEDKKLGYWFAARKSTMEISLDHFVSKVIFYLWNDIFKDYSHNGNSIFKADFAKFHNFFDNQGQPKTEIVQLFLDTLDVSLKTDNPNPNDSAQPSDTIPS